MQLLRNDGESAFKSAMQAGISLVRTLSQHSLELVGRRTSLHGGQVSGRVKVDSFQLLHDDGDSALG